MMTRRALLASAPALPAIPSLFEGPDPKHETIRRAARELESLRAEWRRLDDELNTMLGEGLGGNVTHAFELARVIPIEGKIRRAFDRLMIAMEACGVRSGAVVVDGRVHVGNHAPTADEGIEVIVFPSAKLLNLDRE